MVVLWLRPGGDRAEIMESLIVTSKMNDEGSTSWLADVLTRIAAHPVRQFDEPSALELARPEQASQPSSLSDRYAVLTGCLREDPSSFFARCVRATKVRLMLNEECIRHSDSFGRKVRI